MPIYFSSKKKILHTFLISLAMLLVSCGGGGGDSSSGGGSSSVYTGTYSGTMTATLSSPGATTQNISGVMAIKIDDTGNVSVLLDLSTVWATGTLSGDNFTISSPWGFNEDGIVCNGPATMTGNIQNDQITGTFIGNINCTTQGITIPFTIDGTYTVVKTSVSAAAQSIGFSQSVLSAIQNVLRSAR
ncbi:MAG: hypothetical protein WBN37_11795 [Arenicellales bacterium]